MFDKDELDALLAGLVENEPVQDAGAQVDKAQELLEKWKVKPGDMFALGKHRLICGDCTDKATVERLMGGERADMVFTDPPYNVAYQANESIESLKARNRRTDGLIVQNDAMSDEEFDRFLDSFLSQMPLKDGGAYYLCAPPGRTETQFRNALERVSGLALRECIVWVKDRFVFGRQDYHWRHESILYGWKEGASHYFVDDHTQDTVWEIQRPTVSEFHPTMKPVELPVKAIGNSSRLSEIVYEPFSGSGTTLIACEQLNRQCRACEISPAYVAVALERYFFVNRQRAGID
jgi:DNA modification methylase